MPGHDETPGGVTDAADSEPEVVVQADRRSIAADDIPLASLDADAVAATGASNMAELLRALRPVTQSADGGEPIFLLNAQRVSGYQDIGTLPPEAIERVEVLPEPAALKFGYPPTRRVVNFITKRRFRQVELRATAGSTTRGRHGSGNANLGLTRLRGDGRLTLALEYRRTDAIRQAERDVLPDPDILFDGIGNIAAPGGGEIDPALSVAAGRPVTVAAVPDPALGPATLAGFAAGAGSPRVFDIGPYRTLVPRNDALKAEVVVANRIGASLAGSLSLSAETSRDRALSGPAAATLLVPGGNPFSPFAGPVLLYRYLTEADVLRQRQTTTTLHAGGTLRGAIGGWRWDLTAALDQQRIGGINEQGIDVAPLSAAIAAGANPFAPFDPVLVADRLVDRAVLRTRSASGKAVVVGTPVNLPAGELTLTGTMEAAQEGSRSSTRGPNPFALQLDRTRAEGGLALDVPLASRRLAVLPRLGDMSLTASANARHVRGFGTLYDATYGATWTPITGIQLLATVKHSQAAPALAQLLTPQLRVPNVPVFDFGTGRTEIATLLQGGNPSLLPERRRVRSLQLSIKPFAQRELRVSATYDATTIRDQTGNVYALTPQTEAALPELAVRDEAGRLVSVSFRPINFFRERQRTLNLTVAAFGLLGKPTPPPASGAPKPPERANFYAGIGPTVKFSDRLQLRAGTPELDVLAGETITGGGSARAYGYAYGGLNHLGNGLAFDAWYGGASRIASASPTADLRFGSIFRLNLSGYLSIHHFLGEQAWTQHLQLRVEVSNVTDARQRVRDATGAVPFRYQPDLLDPVGRTVRATLRKLF